MIGIQFACYKKDFTFSSSQRGNFRQKKSPHRQIDKGWMCDKRIPSKWPHDWWNVSICALSCFHRQTIKDGKKNPGCWWTVLHSNDFHAPLWTTGLLLLSIFDRTVVSNISLRPQHMRVLQYLFKDVKKLDSLTHPSVNLKPPYPFFACKNLILLAAKHRIRHTLQHVQQWCGQVLLRLGNAAFISSLVCSPITHCQNITSFYDMFLNLLLYHDIYIQHRLWPPSGHCKT